MLFGTIDAMESQPSSSSTLLGSQPCRHFEFPEIQLATENFDESLVIGEGGFGKVYKGNVINGTSLVVAAIKRLDSMSNQGAHEFWAEVETLSMLRHSNLVSLIGYCNHGKEMILVYEYMPNGTLYDHLHKLGTPLSWVRRLKICIGSGQGLHYLHTGTGIDSGVIHRDVKSANILLHESWAAKISDFGLSKIGPTNQPSTYVNTHVKGTFGYLDPNYNATGRLTRKSDVYAFGVVLMEVLCRKRAVDGSLDWGLAAWAQDSIKEGNLKNIIDSGITDEISPKCLKQFVGIAERCLHSHPKQRPTMNEVVVSLESILTLQEKINSSSQAAGKTIFGRMLMFPFTSVAENSGSGSPVGGGSPAGNGSPTAAVGHGPRRLDRRNAIKNIDYDPSTSSSSSFDNQSTHRTRPLDILSLSDQTSFRIGGIDGEIDLICRSLGLEPDDFSISPADWEARRSNSFPTGVSFPVNSRFRESPESDSSESDDDKVKTHGECSRSPRNGDDDGIVDRKLENEYSEVGNGFGLRARVLKDGDRGHTEGESGIKGVRPPILSLPPVAISRVIVDDLGSNWDLIRSFAPGDNEDLLSDGPDEVTDVEISGMITSRTDTIVSPSGSHHEDEDNGSYRAVSELQYSLSPNGSLTVSFKNWQKGDFLGSGSFGTVYEGFNE